MHRLSACMADYYIFMSKLGSQKERSFGMRIFKLDPPFEESKET